MTRSPEPVGADWLRDLEDEFDRQFSPRGPSEDEQSSAMKDLDGQHAVEGFEPSRRSKQARYGERA